MVTFKSENKLGDCPGLFIKGSKQGLVVIQEWWGLNDQIKEEGEDVAKRGDFSVVVPDLYRGKVAIDKETAGHYMGELDWAGAVKDIRGAAQYLLSQGCTKVGVTGFCMGGALTFAAAALIPEVSAAAPFYGIPSSELCDVCSIKVPLQCHFGEKDDIVGFSSPKDYTALKEKLEKAGVKLDFHTYNAGHAFTNKTGPLGNYNEEFCELALDRMAKFMKENLA